MAARPKTCEDRTVMAKPALTSLILVVALVHCGPGPAVTPGALVAPGTPGSEPSDAVERPSKSADIRTGRWPAAGKPAMCEHRIHENSGILRPEVERAIDRQSIAACARRYKSTEPVVELSFAIAEDGRIVIPHARGVDYTLAACIERAVEDTCVAIVVDDRDKPISVSFTIEMYLTP